MRDITQLVKTLFPKNPSYVSFYYDGSVIYCSTFEDEKVKCRENEDYGLVLFHIHLDEIVSGPQKNY